MTDGKTPIRTFSHCMLVIFVVTMIIGLILGTINMLVILEQLNDIAAKLDQIEELVPSNLDKLQPRE